MRIRIAGADVKINIFIFIVPPLLLMAGYLKEYAIAFFSISLHELGHIAAARFFGYESGGIRLTPIGISVSINDRGCSRQASIIIYSAGPVVNLLLFAAVSLAILALPRLESYLNPVLITNIYLAVFNLIPAFPLDGGRILLELLAGRMGLLAAGRLIRRLALMLSVTLLLFGAWQLYMTTFNFSLIIIGVYIFVLLKTGGMESALMNIRQIIYRRSRLMRKGIYPARDLVAIKSTLLSETLKNMDFDSFHLVYVLDDDLRLLRVFTENEIMDAITGGGESMTFEQLLNISGSQSASEGASFKRNIDI